MFRWAFANNGFGPGVALYTVFGFMASVSGWYVWGVYMYSEYFLSVVLPFGCFGGHKAWTTSTEARHSESQIRSRNILTLSPFTVDSDRHPLRDFGQAFFRVYGPAMRHLVNVLQSLQMFMLVAVLVLSNGGSISQVSIGDNGVSQSVSIFRQLHILPIFDRMTQLPKQAHILPNHI